MVAVSLFWNTNMATVTSCENALQQTTLGDNQYALLFFWQLIHVPTIEVYLKVSPYGGFIEVVGGLGVSLLSTSSVQRPGRSRHETKLISFFQHCITGDFRSAPYFYYADMFRLNSYKAIGEMLEIARFHMTSLRPYCCSKTIKRRPCWCSKPILWELNSFLMLILSFVPINLHRRWPRA